MTTEVDLLKAQLARLQSRPFSGAETVRFGDQSVTYRSVDDMIKLMDYLRRRIDELQVPTASRVSVALADFRCQR